MSSLPCNVSKIGQGFRLFSGILLTAFAFAGGPTWMWLGLFLLASGAWKFCPLTYVWNRS